MRVNAKELIAATMMVLAGALALSAQSTNASISGIVQDSSGAAVPGAALTLTADETGKQAKFTTGVDGVFEFPNLQAGAYHLEVMARGFSNYVQKGIILNINQQARLTIQLQVGAQVQTVQVSANVSALNFENAEIKGTINPQTIASMPLIVGGNLRSAASFTV